MYTDLVPCLFIVGQQQAYPMLGSYCFIPQYSQANTCSFPTQQLTKPIKNQGKSQEEILQNAIPIKRKLIEKAKEKEIPKKSQQSKRKEKDAQFRQRQQTPFRNLPSNTLKIFLKQLRDKTSQSHLNLDKIIKSNAIPISSEEFIQTLDNVFPHDATYFSFQLILKKMRDSLGREDEGFWKIFRISLVRFFRYEIFMVNIKSIRTTRKIRNQQIKQGKSFIRQLTLKL